MKSGIELIAEERQEQIEKHGRTLLKDISQNNNGQLIDGAIVLTKKIVGLPFPKEWDYAICDKMYQKPLKERLIIAGALIAAEIDRLQAIESHNPLP